MGLLSRKSYSVSSNERIGERVPLSSASLPRLLTSSNGTLDKRNSQSQASSDEAPDETSEMLRKEESGVSGASSSADHNVVDAGVSRRIKDVIYDDEDVEADDELDDKEMEETLLMRREETRSFRAKVKKSSSGLGRSDSSCRDQDYEDHAALEERPLLQKLVGVTGADPCPSLPPTHIQHVSL
ncbi:hypothetical protein Avbf_08600 [Armadillidium vulgare]|nr:hypothetical protein Avbf_08600 [Armadillidium vulgare]